MEIFIDFGGFYHSRHSDSIDNQIERDLEWGDDLDEDGFDNVDWKATHEEYGQEYVYRLNNELDLNLEFNAIHSPKYYNYTTEKIAAYVGDVDEQRIFNHVDDKDFLEWANPFLTSRDGFHSFYDGINGLIEMAKIDGEAYAVLLGMIVDWLIHDNEINDDIFDLEFEVKYIKKLEEC